MELAVFVKVWKVSLVTFSDNGTSLEVIILGLGKICYENIHLIHFFQFIDTFKKYFLIC